MINTIRTRSRLLLLTTLLLGSIATQTAATTLLSFSIAQLTEQAAFVFEGEVIHVTTQRSGGRGMISSYVTFRLDDVIKGDDGDGEIELKFLGGTFEGETLEVSASRLPALGERGIYFVESLDQDLINPLLGWSQGQYLIAGSGSASYVTSVDAEPVVSVAPLSEPLIRSQSRSPAALRIAKDTNVAEGIATSRSPARQRLSPEDFKQRIRALLP